MRYRTEHQITHPALVSLILLAMVFFLSVLPGLVFAADGGEPIPRYTLSPKDIGGKVSEAIVAAGIAPSVEASVNLDDPHTMYGSEKPMHVEVNMLQADVKTKLWSANILFTNEGTVMSALPMHGKFQPVMELPVLTRSMNSGDIINAEDVGMQNFPTHYAIKGIVQDANELIGKAVARTITANRPVRDHEITTPIVMKKNDVVQLSYNSNSLHITTSGLALADASTGDVIEFKNVNSNQIIRAQVKDARNASVVPMMQTSALEANHAPVN